MARNLFITGTGTDVGKTYAAALIVKKLNELGKNVGYFKAAVSGNDRDENGNLIPGDALHVKSISGINQPLNEMCPYIYEAAVSPHLASRLEGNPVELNKVLEKYQEVASKYEFITLEGSGGIMCPLACEREHQKHLMLEDVIKGVNAPSLIIADAGLGTINNVYLTAYYMRQNDMDVKGIIFNNYHPGDVMEEDNKAMCEEMTGIKVIACIEPGDTQLNIDGEFLASLYEERG